LNDEQTLQQCDVKAGDSIHMVMQLRGQPRSWGPHGVLQFKLLFFAFMWVFMMSVSPFLIDIFNRIERHMP